MKSTFKMTNKIGIRHHLHGYYEINEMYYAVNYAGSNKRVKIDSKDVTRASISAVSTDFFSLMMTCHSPPIQTFFFSGILTYSLMQNKHEAKFSSQSNRKWIVLRTLTEITHGKINTELRRNGRDKIEKNTRWLL